MVKVRDLLWTVKGQGTVIHYVNEGPRKDRGTVKMCVCVCVLGQDRSGCRGGWGLGRGRLLLVL